MLVDDGFSVLDTDCGIIGERKAVNEVKVVKVPIGQIFRLFCYGALRCDGPAAVFECCVQGAH